MTTIFFFFFYVNHQTDGQGTLDEGWVPAVTHIFYRIFHIFAADFKTFVNFSGILDLKKSYLGGWFVWVIAEVGNWAFDGGILAMVTHCVHVVFLHITQTHIHTDAEKISLMNENNTKWASVFLYQIHESSTDTDVSTEDQGTQTWTQPHQR